MLDLQNELHKTIVFITHDLDEALKIGDKIAILRDGRIIQDSDPQDIILNPIDDYVSDFIKDINRARVIKVKSIMKNTNQKKNRDLPIINKDMVLEEVLQKFSNKPNSLFLVKNNREDIVGEISIKELINGIKRPELSNKNYT